MAPHRRLIIISSLMERWVWGRGAQGGCAGTGAQSCGTSARSCTPPAVPLLPQCPPLRAAAPFSCPRRFLPPLSILSSHLSLHHPAPRIPLQRCSHPQSSGEAGPCQTQRVPKSPCNGAAAGTWVSLSQIQPPTSRLSREDEAKTCQTTRPPPVPRPPCCAPAPGDMRLVRQGQPSNAVQGRAVPNATSLKQANATSRTADGKSYSREGKRGTHQHPQLSPELCTSLCRAGSQHQALLSSTLLSPAPDVPMDTPQGQGPTSASCPQPFAPWSIRHRSRLKHRAEEKKGPGL